MPLLASAFAAEEPSSDQLKKNFISPPQSARPYVWWHWINGNVTKEGISLDLQWMHRIGIGGLQNFDFALHSPQIVSPRLVFGTPQWDDVFRFATDLTQEFGMEFGIASGPGFSESGGPWVTPSQAMKKVVWSETLVKGGTHFTGKLPLPPSTTGPFQNIPWQNPIAGASLPQEQTPDLYKDVAVVAYRLPDLDLSPNELRPVVTSSTGGINARALWDGDLTTSVDLPFSKSNRLAWIEFDYGRPRTIYSMSIALDDGNNDYVPLHASAKLQYSVDGVTFNTIAVVHNSSDRQQTITFAPKTARYFRVTLPAAPSSKVPPLLAELIPTASNQNKVAELILYTAPRVDHFERKAGFFIDDGTDKRPTPHFRNSEAIALGDVVELNSYFSADGTLNWQVPSRGHWTILRVGYSLLGTTNHPAPPETTGLEVDKLSRKAVKSYIDTYLQRYQRALGTEALGQRGLGALVNDSWEADAQNWTEDLPEEFGKRRGYQLYTWLPALTGHIIGSAEDTEHFLWDFRRTLGELLADNYYSQLTDELHKRGMVHYGESHENGRALIGDGMEVKRFDDIPMGAMWVDENMVPQQQGDADLKESASVAHIYGQNLVAAESMTAAGLPGSAYAFTPQILKRTADRELTDGVNRIFIHVSAHQPLNKLGPGITLGPYGQWFTRNETWAELAQPFITYLSRSSYLLQQGHFVGDLVYYYGQDSNITALYGEHLPTIPDGYAYDFANADALNHLSVRDGLLATSSGTAYRVLVIAPRATTMSLDVLKQIAKLTSAGAVIVGDKPHTTPSRSDDDREFHKLVDQLWGPAIEGRHHYGEGWVFTGMSLSKVVRLIGLEPDFSYSKSTHDVPLRFYHRQLNDGDLYFISNPETQAQHIEARFRVTGKSPEFWHADSGVIELAPYRQEGDRTIVPMTLGPYDSVFLVFRTRTQEREREAPQPTRVPLAIISGPWQVSFKLGDGAPTQVVLNHLQSWTHIADPSIRYFSGTATYSFKVEVPKSWLTDGRRIELDLGRVKELAEIFVDGKTAGIAWKSPFRIDLTDMLRPGTNAISIRVTNLWPNRLIGDKQPNTNPVAFTTFNPYQASSTLLDSGLFGPVTFYALKPKVSH
jgi:alpha-L-rhamnosidase/F5/8 type C domain/Glycosyl hydrolases family 2, sugar binding domain